MSALLTRRVGAAAVAILVVAGAGIAAVSTRERRDHSQLTLTMPPGAGSADCNTFDERVLAEMPVAFSGTVTSMTAGGVQIDVDRRFRGVDPATSTVRFTTASDVPTAIEDAITLRVGTRYLVTATDGIVNVWCGYTAPATPQLERAFERAFGA